MEKIYVAKLLEEAKAQAISELAAEGVSESEIEFEVIEQPVKKLFGTKGDYKVKAVYELPVVAESAAPAHGEASDAVDPAAVNMSDDDILSCEKVKRAISYLTNLLKCLGTDKIVINTVKKEDVVVLDITGEGLGVVIGRRGETLDALQYLTILASNRGEENYCRISVDCCGYREKRKEALEALAGKTAHKVLKSGRRVTLEPMNPYERRIIHSKIAEIEGVSSHSTGEEPYRKVVISSTVRREDAPSGRRDNNRRRESTTPGRSYKQSSGFSTSFEREYKRAPSKPVEYSQETVETEKNATLFGKIEL